MSSRAILGTTIKSATTEMHETECRSTGSKTAIEAAYYVDSEEDERRRARDCLLSRRIFVVQARCLVTARQSAAHSVLSLPLSEQSEQSPSTSSVARPIAKPLPLAIFSKALAIA